MSKIKLNIEIDTEIYEAIKKQYEEMSKMLNHDIAIGSVDEYIENILISCAKSGEQMKKLGSKLNDMFEKIGGLDNLGDFDLGSMFNPKTKTEEAKPKPQKPSNLKN
ncbi:MAG: hypothetical protein LBD63_01450 [Mycoplasmataceae bacterium]|jgi:hypothetical protein|nr:hypothetical protein [Mycoplasmataceae bacterium]